jgi:hypothetical protein
VKSRPLPGARFAGLRTGTGLTVADVAARAARYGPNDVAVLPGATWRATLRDAAGVASAPAGGRARFFSRRQWTRGRSRGWRERAPLDARGPCAAS